MQFFQLTPIEGEHIITRARDARQTALLLRFCPDGKCLGVYQSPKAEAEGASNWTLTQGEVQTHPSSADRQMAARFGGHLAAAAAMREVHEELGVVQGLNDFIYLGSVLGCESRTHRSGKADYHAVVCRAGTRKVVPNKEEVAAFRWVDIGGCIAALEAGSFMSPQKTSIVFAAFRMIAREDHFRSTLARRSWPDVFGGERTPAYA